MIKPLPEPIAYARRLRATKRHLRRANELLAQAERFLHDLPDSQCPMDLLAEIRRFTATQGDAP